MEVAFLNRMIGFVRGGAEIWDLRIAEHLQELDVDVTFYYGKPINSEVPNPIEQFESVPVTTPHLQNLAYAAPMGVGGVLKDIDCNIFSRQGVKTIEANDFDVIHVCTRPGFACKASSLDTPIVTTMHGTPHSLYHDYVNPFSSSYRLLECSDTINGIGIAGEKAKERTNSEVVSVNPGVDTELFRPNGESIETDGPTILFVGRFVPAKDLIVLVEAFSEILDIHPDAELILVGDGPLMSRIESKIEQIGISDNVRLPGYVANEHLPKYYCGADVFALSSRSENHPITLMEAMSCGTPVVAPDIGWIPQMITDNQDGKIVPQGDAGELANAIDYILEDKNRREKMGEEGRRRAEEEFEWRTRAESLKGVFESLV